MSGCQEVQPNGSTLICYDANKFSSVCLTPDSGMFARMRSRATSIGIWNWFKTLQNMVAFIGKQHEFLL